MQTICKAVRKQAVCGKKPGGSLAYNLRESCYLVDKKDRVPSKRKTDDNNVDKKLKELYDANMKELVKLKARQYKILNHVKRPNQPLPTPGWDQRVVRIFVAQAAENSKDTIRTRLRKACDTFNEKRGTRSKLEFTYALERLVLIGAINHYVMTNNALKLKINN